MGNELLQSFLAGLTSAFTPCVYPLIPVTLAIFGATAEAPRSRALLLAGCYVFGIAATYTTLGLITAQTGAIFGQFLGNPWVLAVISTFIIAVALFSLDVVQIPGLSTLQTRAATIGGVGPLPAFLMGTVSGIVAAPCVGPFLVTILTLAASSGNLITGGALLFSYSMGFGMIFLALAAFPSAVRSLPRPGHWMSWVKVLISAALLLVLFSLWSPFLPPVVKNWMASIWIALGCIAAGVVLVRSGLRRTQIPLRLAGVVFIALGGYPLIASTNHGTAESSSEVTWLSDLDRAQESAREGSRIILVDLAADWCAACKELERITFVDKEVISRLQQLVTVRLDFTIPDEESDAFQYKYRIQGLPTILFLRPDGSEIPQTRITGFIEPARFRDHIDSILRSL